MHLRRLEQIAAGRPGAGELAATKSTLATLRQAAPIELGALAKAARHALAVWQSPRAWQRDGEDRSRDRAQRALRRLRDHIEREWPANGAA